MTPDRLNPDQQAAIEACDGPVIIPAGPGTGKTRTLAHRVEHLINEKRIPPDRILAVTFTRSAASEMSERLDNLLGRVPEGLWVGTYHALALRILREHNYPFGPDVEWSVIREEEKAALLEGLVTRRERSSFLDELRRHKQRLIWSETGPAAEYRRRLFAQRQLDFDDLFLYATRLFEERPEVAASYRERFAHVMVDEFQDTSFAQYHFLKTIASSNLCVIGDPDQAIYGFAGAFRAFEAFKTDFPSHRLARLSENYRSQAMIVEAAKNVIAKNPTHLPRQLHARLTQGLPIEITRYGSDRHEAEMIVRKIETVLGGSSHFTIDSGWAQVDAEARAYGFGDIVILYRLHAQAKPIIEALTRAGLPYRCFGKPTSAEDLEESVVDEPRPQCDAISLMTLHRAKGLEFPVVFLAGCEERLLPYERSEDTEEERRLFFVGMTRAKQRLFLSSAANRFLYGQTRHAEPSPYLSDIQSELRRIEESHNPARRAEKTSIQPNLF